MYKIQNFKQKSKKIHRIYKIIEILFYILTIPIIIINFTLILKSFINTEEIPDFFGFKSFIIISKSMEPNIKVGDAIFIKKVNENELNVSDIISFHDGKDINTHRIKEITEENSIKYYITKGDNNKKQDKNKITFDDIEGKYIFKIRNFGILINILKSKITLIILIILFIMNIMFHRRIYNRKEERSEKRKIYEETHKL